MFGLNLVVRATAIIVILKREQYSPSELAATVRHALVRHCLESLLYRRVLPQRHFPRREEDQLRQAFSVVLLVP